jgi:3D-(3,5/4)-trihydroxycyclohexane-1,2-dione acylhydrolase (decyclizing)
LQRNVGNSSFNNLLADCRRPAEALPRVDFAMHARSQGAGAEKISTIAEFDAAFERARRSPVSYAIVVDIDASRWSTCDCWWDVGLPEVPHSPAHEKAVAEWNEGRLRQRPGN